MLKRRVYMRLEETYVNNYYIENKNGSKRQATVALSHGTTRNTY